MSRQNLIDFNSIYPYFIYPENKRPRSHGNRNKKTVTKIRIIIT